MATQIPTNTGTQTSPFSTTAHVLESDNYGLNPVDPTTSLSNAAGAPNPGNYDLGSGGSYTGGINGPSYGYNSGSNGNTGSSGGLLSGLSGLLGSNLGQLGLYSGLYELLSGQATNAQNENDTLAGKIGAVGAPAVGESQSLLDSYSQGSLTGPYQAQVAATEGQDQLTATSQSQQSAQALANSGGGQNTTSALTSQQQQIQNAKNQADTQAVASAFQNELTGSNSLLAAGGPYVQQGVEQEISSNTQLQGQLANLMGALASAYAQSVSGKAAAAAPKSSGSSGSGGGGKGDSGSGSGAASGATGPYGHFASGDYNPQNPYSYYTSHGGTGLSPVSPDYGNIPSVDPNFGYSGSYTADYSNGSGGFYGYY